jgi:hypothetical protein
MDLRTMERWHDWMGGLESRKFLSYNESLMFGYGDDGDNSCL